MKTIIAGSRELDSYLILSGVIRKIDWEITEVISGTARGADRLGERWAKNHNIPLKKYVANWRRYGNKAGILRNIEMAEYADALIALWDGESKGTKHMIEIARKKNLKVYVYMAGGKENEKE